MPFECRLPPIRQCLADRRARSQVRILSFTRDRARVLIRISPRIRTLAAELAGSAQGPWATVQRFWDFILDQLISGIMHYDQLDVPYPADQVLDAGWFDCQLGSALLAALCRARRIPARLVAAICFIR